MNWTIVKKKVTEGVQTSVHVNIIGQIFNRKNDIDSYRLPCVDLPLVLARLEAVQKMVDRQVLPANSSA